MRRQEKAAGKGSAKRLPAKRVFSHGPEKRSHLAELATAHEPSRREQTPRIEDYVEMIYELIKERGYAKPVDISSHLHVKPPTVTSMLERLHRDELIVHEKYGGITLTERGREMAETLGQRHALLVQFLRLFHVKELNAQRVTEALEHYVDSETLEVLARFVKFATTNPGWWEQYRKSG